AVLRDGARDADDVAFLKRVAADERRGDLAREDDDRHRVHVGIGDAGDAVGRAGAAGDEHRAYLAGGFGITFGCVGASLLVPHEHMLERGLELGDGVVDLDHRPAGMAEDDVYALRFEAAYEDFCAGQGFRREHGMPVGSAIALGSGCLDLSAHNDWLDGAGVVISSRSYSSAWVTGVKEGREDSMGTASGRR